MSGFSEARAEFQFPEPPEADRRTPDRRASTLAAVREQGLLGTRNKTIGGRVPSALVEAAKARSGIQSDSELLLYALSKVALEDDFAEKILARKGTVPKDVVLDI
jgi:hypothetical protein